jgi:hypothetical protein
MKYTLILFILVTFVLLSFGQEPDLSNFEAPTSYPGTHSYGQLLGNIPALRDLENNQEVMTVRGKNYEKKNYFNRNSLNNPQSLPQSGDPLVQNQQKGSAKLGGAINLLENFEGLREQLVDPPDPTGDIGENHYMQAVNTSSGAKIRAWNKDGTAAMNPLNTSAIWAEVGSGSIGDPIVQYDQDAKRWIFVEMQGFSNNELLLAISDTEDPTGSWKAYRFQASGFPDYPKVYVWHNAYIITVNEIINGNKCSAYALERSKILAGAPEFGVQRFAMPNFGGITYQPATGADWEGGQAPPPNSPAMIFRVFDNSWGSGQDHLENWKIFLNWTTPSLSSIDGPFIINTTPFETVICLNNSLFDCLEQPDANAPLITAFDDIIMYRVPYRNFGAYESVVLNHLSDVSGQVGGGGVAGIRWYELRRNASNPNWEIYQEGTYSPDLTNRFTGTISMDATGNIALGYSVVDKVNTNPGLRITGRQATDLPLGQMSLDEFTLINGEKSHNGKRWGDYSSMAVDPVDGKTFWFTAEYQPENADWGTRIASFNLRRDTYDMRPQALNTPVTSPFLSDAEPVKVLVFNEGLVDATNVSVTLKLEGNTIATETIAGAIPAGQSVEHTFAPTVDVSQAGKNYRFDVITHYENDLYLLNDSIRTTVRKLTSNDAASFGRLNLAGLICASEHQVGFILKNASGLPLTSTNIHYYINNQAVTDYLWTGNLAPNAKDTVFFTISGIINGQNFFNVYTDFPNAQADQDRTNDTLRVKFVGSLNGTPLLVRGFSQQGQLRWEIRDNANNLLMATGEFTGGQLKEVNLCLPDDKCYRLKLRADPIDWFGGIEFYDLYGNLFFERNDFAGEETFEFCIPARKMVDVGSINVLSPKSSPNLTNTELIKIQVRNFGQTPQNALPISYRIDGGAWVTETLNGTLQQSETQEYTFQQTTDLSITGKKYLIETITSLIGDEAPQNDTASYIVFNRPNLEVAVHEIDIAGLCSDITDINLNIYFKNNGVQKIDSLSISIQKDYETPTIEKVYLNAETDEIKTGNFVISFPDFGQHTVRVQILNVNTQGLDFQADNDTLTTTINIVPNQINANFFMQLDEKPEETTWELLDNQGTIVFSGGPYTAEDDDIVGKNWCLAKDSCYTFKLKDSGNDGIMGYISFIVDGQVIFESAGENFGAEIIRTFCAGVVGTNEPTLQREISINPNPSTGVFRLNLPAQEAERQAIAEIYDTNGNFIFAARMVRWDENLQTQISLEKYPSGTYMVRVKGLERNYFGKIVLIRG